MRSWNVDLDWAGGYKNVYIYQNPSNCTLKICAVMICKFALIFKNLRNADFLFPAHWQVKEEAQKMSPAERL